MIRTAAKLADPEIFKVEIFEKRPLLESEGLLVVRRSVFICREINLTCNYELLSVYCETCLHLTLINKALLNLVKNEMELLRSFYTS